MKVGIIGGGVVGQATARAYVEHVDQVIVHDIIPERSTGYLEEACGCDVVFVCLPTSAVDEFFETLHQSWIDARFVLRSTVPIGTTQRLYETVGISNIVHSPEFLTERCAFVDAQIPARNIVGMPGTHGSLGAVACAQLYRERFPGAPLYLMGSNESEAVKLFTNGFFATKVAYFNEIRSLADRMNLDWEKILQGMLSDGRISPAHTKVPGPDGMRGFGGKCLPKDLAMLINCIGSDATVTRAAHERNDRDRP